MIFRNDIQGLRAIAFILVFIFHLNSNFLPGGFLGVDIFFVISGFLMSSIVVTNIDNKKFSFVEFYLKRLKRIIPAYYICVLLIYLTGIFLYTYIDFYSSLNGSFKYAFLFLSNFFFENGESYFGPNLSENPYLHTWSLGVEMQFYLFLPILLYYGRKYLRFILPIVLLFSVLYSCKLIYLDNNLTASYFSLGSRISEFTIGILYAQYFNKGFFKKDLYNDAITWVSLLTLLICVFIFHENMNFPGFLCLIPCIATANILISRNIYVLKFLSNKYLVFIGTLSFSLYLWHWPIMAYMRYENGFYEFSFYQLLIICFLTFILSYLSYKYVEVLFAKFSTKLFFGLMFLIVTISCTSFLNKESLIGYKKIPDIYSRPILGLKSHFEGIVEKFGSTEKEPSFLLVGNSHALMLKPFFNQIGQKQNFSFYSLTCDGYPPIEGIKVNQKNDIENLRFAKNLSPLTNQYIDKVSLVIIAVNNFNDFNIPIRQLADTLLKNNKKLIIINSFPTLEEVNILKVNKGYINKIGKLQKDNRDSLDILMIKKLANEYKNVFYYDLSKKHFFDNAPFYNDTLIYYDSNHLNHYGSTKLADEIGDDFYNFLKEYLK